MKAFNTFLAICSLIAAAAIIGCSDDLHLRNEVGSELTENSDFRISSFFVSHDLWTIPTDQTSIDVILESKSSGATCQLAASVEHAKESYTISLMIPKDKHLPDGDYTITGALSDGTPLGSIIEATVRDEMLHKVLSVTLQYKLKGGGTKANPYLIESANDFNKLLASLSRDDNHAYGLYFSQTADFTAPAESNVVDGRLYTGFDFAGIYDGQNHKITLTYSGASSDEDNAVGLFPTLLDGADISNLKIETMMSGVKNSAGAFAGICTGQVALTNVHVVGTIKGQESIGAFVGNCQGNLTVSNSTAHVMLTAATKVGGAVGSATAGSLTVSNFSSIYAKNTKGYLHAEATVSHVGGVVGYVNNCAINFDHITIEHSIDSISANTEVLKTFNCCGGLIGEAIIDQPSSISDCSIATPLTCRVGYVGGLIGKALLNADLKINSVKVGVYLNTPQYVGGFFGHIITNNHLIIEGKSGQNTNTLEKIGDSYCKIEGSRYVGGLFGYLAGNAEPKDVKLNIPVRGVIENIGGVVGFVDGSTLKCGNISFGSGMLVKGPQSVGGVVGYANSATIEGSVGTITLATSTSADAYPTFCPITVSCDTVNGSPSEANAIGGIVGYAINSFIRNISFSGSVTGSLYVGGIVGHLVLQSQGCLSNCANNGRTIKNVQNDCTGGLAGLVEYTAGTVNNLANFAKVNGQNYSGGIIGKVQLSSAITAPVTFTLALNRGEVSGTVNVGGCFGYLFCKGSTEYSCSITQFGNTAGVSSSATGNVGGIIGHGDKSMIRVLYCANHGDISSSGNAKVGGIAGRLGTNTSSLFGQDNNMEMAYCCNFGDINSSHSSSNVGGLLGYQEDGSFSDETHYMTHDCYNAGFLTSKQDSDNGGVVGYVDNFSEVVCCINCSRVMFGNGVVGTCKKGRDWYHHNLYTLEGSGTTWVSTPFKWEERSNPDTFKGFDFNKVWTIDPNKNDGFPHLKNCTFQFK